MSTSRCPLAVESGVGEEVGDERSFQQKGAPEPPGEMVAARGWMELERGRVWVCA